MKWFKVIGTILIVAVGQLTAQWTMDSSANTPISVGPQDQNSIVSLNSEGGGLIIAWQDGRNGGSSNFDIYAQKLDRFGNTQWLLNGSAVCNALNSQQTPAIITDKFGGAIIVWDDSRVINNLDIYAQRIDAAGNPKWTTDGVSICAATGVQRNPAIMADGQGGAIIAWQDYRSGGSEIDIYAQRVDSMGAVQWVSNGVAVCTVAGRQVSPIIVPDGGGGAIMVWQDQRVSGSSDIYAQRIDQDGSVQWAPDGLPVCTAPNFQESHSVVPTNTNEVLITWVDFRNDTSLSNSDIYAQKISNTGAALWVNDGVPVCTDPESQTSPVLVHDETGGAIIAWDDNRTSDLNVYAQRIDNQGFAQWPQDGIQIIGLAHSQDEPAIIADGQGGAIIAWEDYRDNNFDIYAQRIDPAGSAAWQPNGVAISTATASQRYISMISDLNGGAYLAWEDRRAGSNGDDVYAQQVNANGQIGVVTSIKESSGMPAAFSLIQNYPNPFNASTTIEFFLPKGAFTTIEIYNVLGSLVTTLVSETISAGRHRFIWNADERESGIYYYRLISGDYLQTRKMLLVK